MSNEQEQTAKQRILSGIQPSGKGIFTLGNYIGAVRNWDLMQDEYDCAYFIADLHSLTVRQDPTTLKKQTLSAFALLLACGIDPDKSLLFVQGHVQNHAELGWILDCYSLFGELSRMTQFKDKSAAHADNVNGGLFTYPALMAADILLYQADLVPVGQDQKQHLEFTRDVATRFNNLYGETFKVPDAYIPKAGAKIMSLQEPTKKMSKSDENPNATVLLLDEPAVIMNKFKRAVTDSEKEVVFKEGKDGINNLLTIYCALNNKTIAEAEKDFEGKGYGEFKPAVGETVCAALKPIQDEYARLMADKSYLEAQMKAGAEKATYISNKTLRKARKKVGLLELPR